MNPRHYLWLTEGLELLAFFAIQPIIAIFIAFKASRERPENLSRYKAPCVASGAASVVLIVIAKWLNADVRTFPYFVQVSCFVLGFVLFGACIGCGFAVLLHAWQWHKKTRLT